MDELIEQEWMGRIEAEYNSACLAEQVRIFLLTINASPRVTKLAQKIVKDELNHAHLCWQLLDEYGSSALSPPRKVGAVPKLDHPVTRIVDSFVLGETFAVPLFEAMLDNATVPKAVAVLRKIIQDEKTHSAFGWLVLDELMENGLTTSREVQNMLQQALITFREGYASNQLSFRYSSAQKEFGLIDGETYQNVWYRSYRQVVRPKLESRGFVVPKL